MGAFVPLPDIPELIRLNRELSAPLGPALKMQNGRKVELACVPFLFFAIKGLRTHEAIVLLAQSGYGYDAGVLSRSLLELGINAAWMGRDWPKRAMFFLEHEPIEVTKYRRLIAQWPLGGQPAENEVERTKKALAKADAAKVLPWSGKSLKKMASEAGLGKWYRVAYQLYSDMAHSNVVTARDYVRPSKDGSVEIVLEGEQVHAIGALLVSYFGLYATWLAANAVLDLGLDKHLHEALRRAPG